MNTSATNFFAELRETQEDIRLLEGYIEDLMDTPVVDFETTRTRLLIVSSRALLLSSQARRLSDEADDFRSMLGKALDEENEAA